MCSDGELLAWEAVGRTTRNRHPEQLATGFYAIG